MKRLLNAYCNIVTHEVILYIEKKDGEIAMIRLPENIHRHVFEFNFTSSLLKGSLPK